MLFQNFSFVRLNYNNLGEVENHKSQQGSSSLRTTVPLGPNIKMSLKCYIMHSLVSVVEILKKRFGITGKISGKAGVKVLRGLTKKSVKFSALATFKLSLSFGDVDQQTKLVRSVKKFIIHGGLRSMQNSATF